MKQTLQEVSSFFVGLVMLVIASGFNFDKLIGLENNGIGVFYSAVFYALSALIIFALLKVFWRKLDL